MIPNSYWNNQKILVTGGYGFVGSNLVEQLINSRNVQKENIVLPSRGSANLLKWDDCLLITKGIDTVFHLAADVGGLGYSKSKPGTQLYNCLTMDLNIVEASRINKVDKIILVGCSPAYSSSAPSPFKEVNLFEGQLDSSHLGIGWAKRSMAVLGMTYRKEFNMDITTVIANNSYGPNDNFDLETSHVIPALIVKSLKDKELKVWGDGSALRNFTYVKDLVKGIILAAEVQHNEAIINISSNEITSIQRLVETITEATKFDGPVIFENSKPQGQATRILDNTKAKEVLKFEPKYDLSRGIQETVVWYKKFYHLEK